MSRIPNKIDKHGLNSSLDTNRENSVLDVDLLLDKDPFLDNMNIDHDGCRNRSSLHAFDYSHRYTDRCYRENNIGLDYSNRWSDLGLVK